MYVFGGINLALKRFNDIHEFNFELQAWTRRISLDISPTSRTFHQAVILDDQWLFVFGGFDGMKRNDLYRARVESRNTAAHLVVNQAEQTLIQVGAATGVEGAANLRSQASIAAAEIDSVAAE